MINELTSLGLDSHNELTKHRHRKAAGKTHHGAGPGRLRRGADRAGRSLWSDALTAPEQVELG